MSTSDEKVKEFLDRNPEVQRAMEVWATSASKYEEAMRAFLQMPRVYGGGSTAATPPPATSQ